MHFKHWFFRVFIPKKDYSILRVQFMYTITLQIILVAQDLLKYLTNILHIILK